MLCQRSLNGRGRHLLTGLLTLASCSSTPHSAGVSSPSNTTRSDPFSCLASWVRVTPSRRSTSAGKGTGQRGVERPLRADPAGQTLEAPASCSPRDLPFQ